MNTKLLLYLPHCCCTDSTRRFVCLLLPAASCIIISKSSFSSKSGSGRLWLVVPHIPRLRNAEWRVSADSAHYSPSSVIKPSHRRPMAPLTRRDPDHLLPRHIATVAATSKSARKKQLNHQLKSIIFQHWFLTQRRSILVSSFRIIYHQLSAGIVMTQRWQWGARCIKTRTNDPKAHFVKYLCFRCS